MSQSHFGDVSLDPHEPILPSFTKDAFSNKSGSLYSEPFLLAGVVIDIYPPNDPRNRSQSQYEYIVSGIGKLQTFKLLHCAVKDKFGGTNDFEVYTLKKGQRVLVECLLGFPESGIIVGGLKNRDAAVDVNLGDFWMRRFNKITNSVTKDSTYYIKNDSGNQITVENTKITLDDGQGDVITVDQANKKITITDASGQSIVIDRASGQITMSAKKMSIMVEGDAELSVSGNANIKGSNVNLNNPLGAVVTTATHPVDYLTGIPIQGVLNVKAG